MFQRSENMRIIVIIMSFAILASCDYREYADSEYPEQSIYMPAAGYNVYEVKKGVKKIGAHPTEGDRFRYRIEDGKFVVPLSVYRAGIDRKGTFDVIIQVDTDTISALMNAGTLAPSVKLLGSEHYNIPSIITVLDGHDSEGFDLVVDLAFLLERNTNAPDEQFALGVTVSSNARRTNPNLETTIILIDPKASTP